jgi:hypothetical protein
MSRQSVLVSCLVSADRTPRCSADTTLPDSRSREAGHQIDGVEMDDVWWGRLPPVLSIADIALVLRADRVRVLRWLADGILPGHRIAAHWVVYRDALRHFIEHSSAPQVLPREFLGRFPHVLAVEGVAAVLGVDIHTADRWISIGALPETDLRGRRGVRKDELEHTLRRSATQPIQPTTIET